MTGIDDIYAGKFLKVAQLVNWPMQCHIVSTEIVVYEDGKKAIGIGLAQFPDKILGLNKTNVERLRVQIGDDWEFGWVGQSVVLIQENVEFQGKITPAIRVQMPQPTAPQQPIQERHLAPQQPSSGAAQQALSPGGPPTPHDGPQSFDQVMRDSGFEDAL